jgi:hypothetical protein
LAEGLGCFADCQPDQGTGSPCFFGASGFFGCKRQAAMGDFIDKFCVEPVAIAKACHRPKLTAGALLVFKLR